MEYTCKICSRPFDNSQALNSHVRHCRLAKEGKTWVDVVTPSTLAKFEKLSVVRLHVRPKCAFCGKECKELGNKFCSPECAYRGKRYRKGEPRSAETKKKIGDALRKNIPLLCVICGDEFTPKIKGYLCCSAKCGNKRGAITRTGVRHPGKGGGCREGSERSKSGWYKGFYCGSTYELIFLVYHLERDIKIKRASASLPYEFEGRICHYHPDFEIDGKLYEIKGYMNAKAEAKRQQFSHVIIIDGKEIKQMQSQCSLVSKKLPKLVAMYDKSKVALTIRGNCANCGEEFIKSRKTSMYCTRRCSMVGNRAKRHQSRAA